MSCVVGIDQSVLHTGVCVLDLSTGRAILTLIEPPAKLDNIGRLVYLYSSICTALKGVFVPVSVLEGYSIGSLNRPFDLGEVGGITKLAMFAHSAKVYAAAPKQLKKFVTGNGSASKEQVQDGVQALWGARIENDNLADAYGLAQIAACIVDPTRAVRRAQTEISVAVKATLEPKAKPKAAVKLKRLSI